MILYSFDILNGNFKYIVVRGHLPTGIVSQIKFNNVYIDMLVQERRNSSALAMELCLSCTNPAISYSSNTFQQEEYHK